MSETLPSPAPPPAEPTDTRFRLRFLLTVMVVVAVVAAAVGPYVRSLAPDEQSRVMAIWLIWSVGLMGVLGFRVRRRLRDESLIGPTLLRLPGDKSAAGTGTESAASAFWGFLLFQMVLVLFADRTLMDALFLIFCGCVSIWHVSTSITTWLWRDVRVAAFGLLSGQEALLWTDVVKHRWISSTIDRDTLPHKVRAAADRAQFFKTADGAAFVYWTRLELSGLNPKGRDVSLTIPVAPEYGEALHSIVEQGLATRPVFAGSDQATGISKIPAWTLLSNRQFHGQLAKILVSLILVGGLSLYALFGSGVRGFEATFFFGLLLSANVTKWVRTGRIAGQPIARVFASRDWIGFIGATVAALVLWEIGRRYGLMSSWVVYAAGLLSGGAAGLAAVYFWQTQLDMRANGLVLENAFFWPWEGVRVLYWNRDSGRLVLGRGWRRLTAHVRPDARTVVEATLREKLGNETLERASHA